MQPQTDTPVFKQKRLAEPIHLYLIVILLNNRILLKTHSFEI